MRFDQFIKVYFNLQCIVYLNNRRKSEKLSTQMMPIVSRLAICTAAGNSNIATLIPSFIKCVHSFFVFSHQLDNAVLLEAKKSANPI